jgi:hypothetical protein
MSVSDSSVGGTAGQFHTTRWTVTTVPAESPNRFVSLVLCDALVVAEGGLRP